VGLPRERKRKTLYVIFQPVVSAEICCDPTRTPYDGGGGGGGGGGVGRIIQF
jgi:hypothetical protein